jgi:hypothetical protein
MALLEGRLARLDGVGAIAHDHGHVTQPHSGQVRQADVEDRGVPVHRHERLGQRVGVGPQPPSPACGEHETDHRPTTGVRIVALLIAAGVPSVPPVREEAGIDADGIVPSTEPAR